MALAARPAGLLFRRHPVDDPAQAWEHLIGRYGPDLAEPEGTSDLLAHATAHFRAYFDGDAVAVRDLPVLLDGTPFEIKAWEATRALPWGRTASYGDVAWEIEHPRSAEGGPRHVPQPLRTARPLPPRHSRGRATRRLRRA